MIVPAGILLSVSAWLMATPAQHQADTFAEFNPRSVIWLNENERHSLVRRSEESGVQMAFAPLRLSADRALARSPNPIAEIIYEGHVGNHPSRIRTVAHLQDMVALHDLTWSWVLTSEDRYRMGATDYLLAWAKTYQPLGNNVNENKLSFCFYAYAVLRDTLTEKQDRQIRVWLRRIGEAQVARWQGGSTRGNRAIKRIKIVLLAGIALDDQTMFRRAEEKLQVVLDLTLNEDGSTHDFLKRDAMHYHMSSLKALLEVNYLLRTTRRSLYAKTNTQGGSLYKSIAFCLPYIRRERTHLEWVGSKVKLDKQRWEAGDEEYRPGKPWDPLKAYGVLTLALPFQSELRPLRDQLIKEGAKRDAWLETLIDSIDFAND